MHPNSLKNLKMWAKGQYGNPNKIYSKIPEELKGIKSLTRLEIIKIISKYARMDLKELQKVLLDRKVAVLELNIASIFDKSIKTGDFQKLSFLLDRAVPKIKDDTEEDEDEASERKELGKLSMNELLTIVKNNLPEEIKE